MKKLTKRTLSLLLAFSMLFALIPAMAFADDTNTREFGRVSILETEETIIKKIGESGDNSGDEPSQGTTEATDEPISTEPPIGTDTGSGDLPSEEPPRPATSGDGSGDESGDGTTEEPVEPITSGDESGDESGDGPTEEPVEPITSGDNSGDNSGDGPTEEPVEPVTSGDESGDGSGEPVEEPSGDQETSGEESGESGEKPDGGKKTTSSGSGSYKNITVKSSKGGKVSPSSALVRKGKTQEFTFTPDEGYEVVEVLVDGEEVDTDSPFVFTNEDGKSHSIEVKFDKIKVWTRADVWAVPELEKANKKGILPEIYIGKDLRKNITRKEFASLAVDMYEKLTGKEAYISEENPFEDTKSEDVLKAYALGITVGTSETTFSPDRAIDREEMSAMATRALKAAGVNTEIDLSKTGRYQDDAKIRDWARPSVYFMASHNIIKGVGDNEFDPFGTAKIEEGVIVSLRCIEKFAK